jgi:hypothetical protein
MVNVENVVATIDTHIRMDELISLVALMGVADVVVVVVVVDYEANACAWHSKHWLCQNECFRS